MVRSVFGLLPVLHLGPQTSLIGVIALGHIHNLTGTDDQITWISVPLLCRWHPDIAVFSPRRTFQSLTISQTVYRAYPHHYLQIKIGKTELLLFLANQSIHHNIAKVVESLGITIDAQQSFSDHIASGSWSCCFASFNTQKISQS